MASAQSTSDLVPAMPQSAPAVTALSIDSSSPGTIAYFASASGNQSQDCENDGAETKQRVTKKPKKKRSGWGRFQSVLKERSVDFNLTLDVQNLKQEIQAMENLRDILLSKTLIHRHDRNGSLARTVEEHYRIFRTGFNVNQTGRKRLMNENDQKEFLWSVFDENVDIGDELTGVDAIIQQFMLYTVFIKAIGMTMTSFEVIVLDDTVVVATKGVFRFQILRNTIAGMFPHIIGEEWLVSQLVGQEVVGETTQDFHFNRHGKVVKYEASMDFVKAFAEVLKDPALVDVLLGRAMITENWLIIPNNDMPDPDSILPIPKSPAESNSSDANSGGNSSGSGCDGDTESRQDNLSPASPLPSKESYTEESTVPPRVLSSDPAASNVPDRHALQSDEQVHRRSGPLTPADHFSHVVRKYFQIFATGSHVQNADVIAEYLNRYYSMTVTYGSGVGRMIIEDRWRSLSWCFDLVAFRQLSQKPVVYQPQQNQYVIHAKARYTLGITARTLELVFPHVIPELELMDALVGSTLEVDTQVSFWLERGTGLVSSIREQMDFKTAMSAIVKDASELEFVLSRANHILTSYVGEVVDATEGKDAGTERVSLHRDEGGTAKMRLSNILG
ncbi:hypothetical protein FI667_g14556, partial [Globisporangium splendens]